MGEADVILGIRIKDESNGIAIPQSHYIEKVLKKFNYFDSTPVSTLMDASEKLMPNSGQAISQLEYSRVFGCLMYAMTCTRPNVSFVVGKLSRYNSNPGTLHWQAIQRVLKYLKKTMDYRLVYTGCPLASKKQTCITSSTMESKFMALAATGKEVEWLKNLLFKIPLWVKPIALISIRYDSAATLAKAYSQMYNGKSRHLGMKMVISLMALVLDSPEEKAKGYHQGVIHQRKYPQRVKSSDIIAEKKSATSSSSRTMSSPISGLKVKSPSADSSFRTSLSGSLPQKLSILGKEKKSATSSSSRTMSSPISGLKVKSPSADSSFRTSLSGSLPQKLSILGKEAVQQQERAQRIAFEALRNASATNTLVWSLQNLSTLTKSANSVDPTDCFDNFLKFHNQLIQAIADIISIKAATETTKKEETTPKKSTEVNGPDSNNISKRKSALHKSVSSFPGKSLQKSTVLGKHTRSSGVDQNGKTGSLNDTIKLGQQIEIEAGNWFMELLDKHLGNGMRYSKPDAKKVPHSLIVKALNWVESNQCDSRNNRVHPKAIDIARKLRIKAKRMASSEIRHRPYPCPTIAINLPKAMDKPRKSLNRPKGVQIKVQSPSSASAVRVRFSNVFVLTKVLTNDSSLVDVGKGKRSNSSVIPIDDALTKVLDKMAYIKCVSEQMVFCEGVRDFDMKSSNAVKIGSNVKDSSMQMVTDCDKVENDGSFINGPVRKVNDEYDKQTIGSDKVECREDFNMVDSTLSTDNVSVHNVADVEHVDDAHRGHHPPQPPLSSALAHVTYGDKSVEKYVGYSKLNYENYCFVTELNKSCEPKIEASKYTDWTDAMNEEMNALLRNDT
ncbi:zinc finger, CCHC-type containing protein [Tanacetum coccineum]